MRYYSFHRPLDIGTFPKPAGNRILTIYNYDDPPTVEWDSRKPYGYIEYEYPLDPKLADDYELEVE